MPFTGGASPSPERYGGGVPLVQRIAESLRQYRGTAFSQDSSALVDAEHIAYARAIEAAWSTAQRLGNQWDPDRITDFLERWEKIFALSPLPGATDVARRAAIKVALQKIGSIPTFQGLYDLCESLLGSNFVGIVHTTVAAGANGPATIQWPVGGYNGGDPNVTFGSTVAHVLVQTVQLTNQTDAQFYDTMGLLTNPLNDFLPAWVTWDWFRVDTVDLVKGFYLDHPVNLDNSVFDV